jgi:L-malate glycosyltransferase
VSELRAPDLVVHSARAAVAAEAHPVRILYVNHTARVSGAERSLLDLIGALPGSHLPLLACPEGELSERARRRGVATVPIPAADAGLRAHPVHAARAAVATARGAITVARAARRHDVAAVHANSVRSGLIALLASRLGAPAPVVHLRDCLPATAVTDRIRRAVDRRAAAVVANSAHTAAAWGGSGSHRPLDVVPSPVDLSRFDPALVSRSRTRRALGLPEVGGPVLGVVGQLTPWKGQDDAIRVTALLRTQYPDVRLLVAGDVEFDAPGTSHDNRTYAASLVALAQSLGVAGAVRFLGRREDVPALISALDVLLVPSWEEPLGRTVLEGMAMGRPVVATSCGGPRELLDHGHTGWLAPPRDPEAWAATVTRALHGDAQRRVGEAAAVAVRAYGLDRHVSGVLAIYDRIMEAR